MATQLRSRLEYADLANMPRDERRYELLDGALTVSPSATPLHQRVSKRLLMTLVNYFESSGLGEVFAAPTDVILTVRDVFVPDLVVVTQPTQVSARAIEGPPALIVEILSPTNAQYDRVAKARRYATLGVSHYWIVDPKARVIECYRNVDGRFVEVRTRPPVRCFSATLILRASRSTPTACGNRRSPSAHSQSLWRHRRPDPSIGNPDPQSSILNPQCRRSRATTQ